LTLIGFLGLRYLISAYIVNRYTEDIKQLSGGGVGLSFSYGKILTARENVHFLSSECEVERSHGYDHRLPLPCLDLQNCLFGVYVEPQANQLMRPRDLVEGNPDGIHDDHHQLN
jgi:hypothetical protein